MFWLELPAALLTLLCVYLAVRENVWTWPVGVVSVALYGVHFWLLQLHALAGLQVVLLLTQFYGWYVWATGSVSAPLPVQRTSVALGLVLTLLGIVGTVGIVQVLLAWPPPVAEGQEQSPFWRVCIDAGLTAFNLVGQWMLARKLLENWLLWIVVDVVSVGFFFVDGQVPTAILYVALTVLCVLGYQRWRREGVA